MKASRQSVSVIFALILMLMGESLARPSAIRAQSSLVPRELWRAGRGHLTDMAIQPHGDAIAVGSALGLWLYPADLSTPELLSAPDWVTEEDAWVDEVVWAFDSEGESV